MSTTKKSGAAPAKLRPVVSELDFGIDRHPAPCLEELWRADGCQGDIGYRLMVCSPFQEWTEDGKRDVSLSSRLLDLMLYYASDDDIALPDRSPAWKAHDSCPVTEVVDWLMFDPDFNALPATVRCDIVELASLDDHALACALDTLTRPRRPCGAAERASK
jgi:hypothetical protein